MFEEKLISSKNNIAVVVLSCDNYADIWEPFFTLFFKYWPDCPYPVYLVSETLNYNDPRINIIINHKKTDWSSNLFEALNKLHENYAIILMEDYFLQKKVDTKRIEDLFHYMKSRHAGCLRIYPNPGPDILCEDNPTVGVISKGREYRLSLQAAIWKKETILALLKKGETAWDFEINGTIRTNELNIPFLSVLKDGNHPIDYYCTAIVRCKWEKEAVELCEKEGINIEKSLKKRKIRCWWDKGWIGQVIWETKWLIIRTYEQLLNKFK